MCNYSKNTLISFYSPLFGGDLIENLPFPNWYALGSNKGFFFAYLLEGTFNTNKQIDFLNDLIARFYITFKAQRVEKDNVILEIKKPYKAKQIAQSDQLNSLKNLKDFSFKQNMDGKKDKTFWALKLFAIENIRSNGILNYRELENFGMANFVSKKGVSDIRCKCKSIYNYYKKRDFEIEKQEYTKTTKTSEDIKMTRIENCKKIALKKEEENNKKVMNFLSGMFSFEYKKPNGSWHVSKIAKILNLSRNTVYKGIKQLEQNKELK